MRIGAGRGVCMNPRARKLLSRTISLVERLYVWLLTIRTRADMTEFARIHRQQLSEQELLNHYRAKGYGVGPRGDA